MEFCKEVSTAGSVANAVRFPPTFRLRAPWTRCSARICSVVVVVVLVVVVVVVVLVDVVLVLVSFSARVRVVVVFVVVDKPVVQVGHPVLKTQPLPEFLKAK